MSLQLVLVLHMDMKGHPESSSHSLMVGPEPAFFRHAIAWHYDTRLSWIMLLMTHNIITLMVHNGHIITAYIAAGSACANLAV